MRKRSFVFLMIIIVLHACNSKDNSLKITGQVINSDSEYIILDYQPLYRGNLNFEGFKSVCDRIDNDGKFTLNSSNPIDYADYYISTSGKSFHLILSKGDNLILKFDLKNIDSSLFASGRGAGKINTLRLKQFDIHLAYDSIHNKDSLIILLDSKIKSKSLLLDAIYHKEIDNKEIQKAENKERILRIIKESPLTKKEYNFIKKSLTLEKIYNLEGLLSYSSRTNSIDSSIIDFDNPYFNCFNLQTYKMIENINYWQFEDCINRILKTEYLRLKQKENNNVTYNRWSSSIKDYTEYRNWGFSFVKENFKPEVCDRYFASALAFELTLGIIHEGFYKEFTKKCSNKKYLDRLDQYLGLIKNGLNNTGYNLSNSSYTLDSTKFQTLISESKGNKLFLVIWSAEYAGASLITELPSVLDFEKNNADRFKVLYLCIDKSKNKGLWAARIIDNSWKGTHYFLPLEDNDKIIEYLGAKNNDSFCYGGVTYSFLTGNGKLINNIESPFMLTKETVNQYLENTIN